MAAPVAKATSRIPRAVRATAWSGIALTVAYVLAVLAVRQADPAKAAAMVRMYGLTIVAGRETAMLDALQNGLPPAWVYALSVVDDVGSLLLALPFTWFVVRFLRGDPRVRWWLSRFEKQALLHRAWVRRWGLGGLALVYYLPGFGAGVPITVLLAILARIPFGVLVPFFIVATLVVDGLWSLALTGVVRALPDQAWVDAIPLVVVGLVLASAAIGAWRRRHERHVAVLDWPVRPSPERIRDLASWGVRLAPDGLVHADLDELGRRLQGHASMGQRLITAELTLLDGLTPVDAERLAQAGVSGLEHLAGGHATDLARLAARAGVDWDGRGARWIAEARMLVDEQHTSWRRAA